jgi:hypothetical protein
MRYLWKMVSQSVLVLNFDGKCWKVTENIIQKLVLNEQYNWVKQAGGKIWIHGFGCTSDDEARHGNYNRCEIIKSIISARCSEYRDALVITHVAETLVSIKESAIVSLIKEYRGQPYGHAEKLVHVGGP